MARTGFDTIAGMMPEPVARPAGNGMVQVGPPARGEDGCFSLTPSRYIYDPRDTRVILSAAAVAVSGDPAGPKFIYFNGGPRHGESEAVTRDPGRYIRLPKPVPATFSIARGGVNWVDYDQYFQTEDFILNRETMPCRVYEHEDLRKANVQRRASELDAQIAVRRSNHNDLKETAKLADQKQSDYYAEHLWPLEEERDKLTQEHYV